MTAPTFAGDGRLRTAAIPGTRWLRHVALWRPLDPDQLTTGDVETGVVLLSGTFDLVGGGTAWPARGARPTPFAGRPMALFLPPRTDFQSRNGSGEMLLVGAAQPAPRAEATGREALANRPLLPLAGSGKSFDPRSGEWMPAESFPAAAESLPPRRFERIPVGACWIERLLAPNYKAATLSLDEVVIPAGAALRLAEIPGRPPCDEAVVFVRDAQGDRLVIAAGAGDEVVIAAANGPAYAVIAYAGKPASGS